MNRFGFMHLNSEGNERVETYTVKKGDSLYNIAKKYKVSVDSLIKANSLNGTLIFPGQVIVIPVKIPSGAMYFEEYVIEPDDTIESIAQKLGISSDIISRYNDITRLVLMENQKINIPKAYSTYTVLENDTLETILGETNMTCSELIEANKDKWLIPGTEIYVKKSM